MRVVLAAVRAEAPGDEILLDCLSGPRAPGAAIVSAERIPASSPRVLASPRGPLGEALVRTASFRDADLRVETSLPADLEARAAFLRLLDQRPEVIASACGEPVEAAGASFHCRLPGHAKDGIARVKVGAERVVYACDCDRIERSLTEVYANLTSGIPRRRGRGEFVRWKLRLAIEAGVLEPPKVSLPPLPATATTYAVRVYAGLRLLVAVRELSDGPDAPFPFARSFVAEWCGGLDREQANAGIKALVRAGILVKVGTTPAGAYTANLYAVGPA